ncbi:hypothetical protein DASC09_045920 [Saccharomycopsis crataegensis]|uniref:Uncharacterized protein n=1 Tax=Saccharomycopsis crataegensis TaxID=43959 RepID=A0AAV5QS81_9ASCO|nr:hypothetical protein DASC09_045920 [Saccharomycopsis crataegensis]
MRFLNFQAFTVLSLCFTISSALVIPSIARREQSKIPDYHAPSSLNHTLNSSSETVPIYNGGANSIPHKYIVIFKDNLSANDMIQHKQVIQNKQVIAASSINDTQHSFFNATRAANNTSTNGGIITEFNVTNNFIGYAGFFLPETLETITESNTVKYIEQDTFITAQNEFITQYEAPWGLERISQRDKVPYQPSGPFVFADYAGEGVNIYVVDTGIQISHKDFNGRVIGEVNFSQDENGDLQGHGTHVAGTAAGEFYGVAKKANIISVKVLDNNKQSSCTQLIQGLQWTINDHHQRSNTPGFRGSVINASIGGSLSIAVNNLIEAAVFSGIHVVVAAGNSGDDACNYSPAASPSAITVGATTVNDTRADFSNYGSCVDIWAPGLDIQSDYIGPSNQEVAWLSGTSMASPHVAGVVAYLLSLVPEAESEFKISNIVLSPANVKRALQALGSKGKLSGVNSQEIPNDYLLFNGANTVSDYSQFYKSMSW